MKIGFVSFDLSYLLLMFQLLALIAKTFMETIILIIHVIVSLSLLVTVLLQSGKGGGLGSGFGGAAASATKIFGGGGTTNVLGRATVVLATIFMATSLTLAYLSSQDDSIMDLTSKGKAATGPDEEQIVEEGKGTGAAAAPAAVEEPAPAGTSSVNEAVELKPLEGEPTAEPVAEPAAEPVAKPEEAKPAPAEAAPAAPAAAEAAPAAAE